MKKERKYKAIIFDLDGTLINSLPYHFMAFKDLLLEHNIRIADNQLKKLQGLSTLNILKALKKKYKFKENLADLREERRYHYFKFLGNRDITFPGVKAMLGKLRLNYKIAIATGSSKVTFTHSTDKDFQNMFDFVSTINDVKKGKPHPEQLFFIARKLKVKPEECLMIGDSIYDGITAKNAKMDFIGVLSGYTSKRELMQHSPRTILKNVNALPKFL
jgi:HAD superfamily hydrolase (TIGR01549 family)